MAEEINNINLYISNLKKGGKIEKEEKVVSLWRFSL